jgi:hypothetical protein
MDNGKHDPLTIAVELHRHTVSFAFAIFLWLIAATIIGFQIWWWTV